MKNLIFIICAIYAINLFSSCKDDDNYELSPGNPVLEAKTDVSSALFGDSLPFTANVSDNVPLSVLKAQLFFGDDIVDEQTIRTKTDGEYSGKLFIPYYKNVPDGTATLELTLTDTHLSRVTKSLDINVKRPEYPYLILVTSDKSYPMVPTGKAYEYAATESFPSTDLNAYIKTPAVGANGNEITFGWENGAITEGSKGEIPFSSSVGGVYSVTFNTKTYEAGPFFELTVNGQRMSMVDKENFSIDMNVTQGETLKIEGLGNIAEWWIDPDFFTRKSDNEFAFAPITGKYRIIANTTLQYFRIETLSGNDPATLQADGTGAIWVIGTNVGKPTVAGNEVGWNTDKALCMAPIGDKKYRLTVVGGQSVSLGEINFKFFHQKGWGGEFTDAVLTTTSNIVFVGSGGTSGRDPGNLGLVDGVTLEANATYVFIVDVSAGISNGVLTVTKK